MGLWAPAAQAPHKEHCGVLSGHHWHPVEVSYLGRLSVETDIPVCGCESLGPVDFSCLASAVWLNISAAG